MRVMAEPALREDGFAARAHRLHALHADKALEPYAANLHGRVELLEAGALTLPVLVCDGQADSAWTCSPRVAYSDAAIEESERNLPRWLQPPVRVLARGLGGAMAPLERVVILNHWLQSTDLYPALDSTALDKALAQARERWPGHALWFRSLNHTHNTDWLQALSARGFDIVASRQVYLYEDFQQLRRKHVNLQRDLQLLQRTLLRRAFDTDIGESDYARIAELYRLLYLDKYSQLNPRYTAAFMRAWHREGLLEFQGFRDAEGQLACIVGMFRQGGAMTSPIVGYDTAQSKKLGLYRLLTACAYDTAMQSQLRLNFSAGAADFKRVRGGAAAIEYGAFYTAHLPAATRRKVRALAWAARRIGEPLLRRYEL